MWGSREQSEVIHGCTSSGTTLEEGGAVRRCNHGRVVRVWLDAIGAKGLRLLRGVEWQAACEVQPWHGASSGPGAGPAQAMG